MLEDLTTGILYRNPRPHVQSIHAYFPSVVVMPDGEMVALYTLGEAFEATNLHTHLARSSDGGRTWLHQGRICPDTAGRLTTEFGRLSVVPGGELVAVLVRADRTDHPEEGLANPENLGFVPTEILITRSSDAGRTWSEPALVAPPLEGPSFELCCPVTVMADGRWLWPTSTWRDWEGNLPSGNRMVAFVSEDQGDTWPDYLDVMSSPEGNLIFWESKIVELAGGRLLAVAWCHDEASSSDRPNQYALSDDGGATWTPPGSTGLLGQTMTPVVLGGDRVLSVYRRMDEPGLWANLSHLEGDRWVNDACWPLWGHQSVDGVTRTAGGAVAMFQTLRFGAPSITPLADGALYVAFWCYEDCVSVIRWFKFQIPP
ncbi:MAG: sialidase family protein [Planctomycetota bacterium]